MTRGTLNLQRDTKCLIPTLLSGFLDLVGKETKRRLTTLQYLHHKHARDRKQ